LKRAIAHLPLHGGSAPRWLFARMERLAGAITQLVVDAYGADEMLARLADPVWFQAFGCVLGFDWHSSGLTTVTCGALRQAYVRMGDELGICVAGGKGGTSRKTPGQIEQIGERTGIDPRPLVYASRMSAKVDSAAVQDGYQLYHHNFFWSGQGRWCVVQQGMSQESRYARRYHWLGSKVDSFVCEPHSAVAGRQQAGQQLLLNMVADEASASRQACAEVARIEPAKILAEVGQGPSLFLPARHAVHTEDVDARWLGRLWRLVYEHQPADFERLLGLAGVGPKAVRSLALVAELVYGASPSRKDPGTHSWQRLRPAAFSYAHGGKDGHPFPVDRELYDRNIAILEDAVRRARVDANQKDHALRRLAGYLSGAR